MSTRTVLSGFFSTLLLLALVGCGSRESAQRGFPETFAHEVSFMRQHGDVQILEGPSGSQVALSAQYQGRVMTSAIEESAASLGWINHDFIEAGETGTQFDNYGGEDRFWLGPEGGQYGLYFTQGDPFEFTYWQVPRALHEGTWTIQDQSSSSITFTRSIQVTNYSGVTFQVGVQRTVRLLSPADIRESFDVTIPDNLQWVGFETANTVTNIGTHSWQPHNGLPSIWILGQFNPFDVSYVVMPYNAEARGEIVNTKYFGEIPQERLDIRDNYLIFKCDGNYRSKIGLNPDRATPVFGSYIPSKNVLTLIHYNLPPDSKQYVNSMWEHQAHPYGGDVINSYNDGPTEPGQPALGGFYEMETSSPALALSRGESFTHTHRTLHIVGDPLALNPVADHVLRVSASMIADGI